MHTCPTCNKSFNSEIALRGHSRVHTTKIRVLKTRCCCVYTKRELTVNYLAEYQSNLKKCKHCDSPIVSNKNFCNSSCAAKYNNVKRHENGYSLSQESKDKRNVTRAATLLSQRKVIKPDGSVRYDITTDTMYSKISHRSCKHCESLFIVRSKCWTKYCTKCSIKYEPTYRNRYKFTFNVYNYPDLFDLNYIKAVGWYSRGGKAGKWNPDGLSRDHKVSVTEAIKYDYDPYYIKHPLNCEIMTWLENNKKNGNSSITYEQLVHSVIEYDNARTIL